MAAHQAPPSLGFFRQEHWSGLPFPSPMHESEKGKWSRSVVSNPQLPHGLQPSRLLHPWDFPGRSTGVGCHCLLRLSSLSVFKIQPLHNTLAAISSFRCCRLWSGLLQERPAGPLFSAPFPLYSVLSNSSSSWCLNLTQIVCHSSSWGPQPLLRACEVLPTFPSGCSSGFSCLLTQPLLCARTCQGHSHSACILPFPLNLYPGSLGLPRWHYW